MQVIAAQVIWVMQMAESGTTARVLVAEPASSLRIDWQRFLKRPLFTSCASERDHSFAGKTVLITGAAGSIGSSLSEQLMEGRARKLVLLDRSVENLRQLYRRYRDRDVALPAEFIQGDILSHECLQKTFSTYRPEIIFHAAALKDIPPLESDPFNALENNALGTVRLAQAADDFAVECLVNVSTDKAVNPASILGVSKRIAELFLATMESSSSSSSMRRISLRSGNVLGSSGSVVPIFIQLIRDRKPLLISDPLASRYFLTLEETAAFLSQSLLAGKSCLLLPEMGDPHKIVDLARFLLGEFGEEGPSDMIKFVGLKDGEKQSEQLRYDYEWIQGTVAPGLYQIGGSSISDPERFTWNLDRLTELVGLRVKTGLLESLLELVPEFSPSPTLLRHVG